VAGGMVLRLLTGGGAPLSFVLVTSLFLAATMLGWRAVARLLAARTRRHRA
jgi:membrane protein implicated in regulation of membrane protease activity